MFADSFKIRNGYADTIGRTPIIKLEGLSKATGCNILGKAEYLNPGLSVKDRAAKFMIEAAEKQGILKPGGWIVEATAGNTGVGLCHAGHCKGYKVYLAVPPSVSIERVNVLRVFADQVEVCESVPLGDPKHFQSIARQRAEELGGFFTNQFESPYNIQAHYETTGPEIWEQTEGKVDAIIMATGTGGTLGGSSLFLKTKNNNIKCYVAEIVGSGVKWTKENDKLVPTLKPAEEKAIEGVTIMEGIGSSRVYYAIGQAAIDGVIDIDDTTAVEMSHYLLKYEGLFLGGSSGVNVSAAVWLAKRLGPGHTIVTILCDAGTGYTGKVYNERFLMEKNIFMKKKTAQDFLDAFDGSQIKLEL